MKVAVLLSGGVDSSVALRLLARQGHDLTAFYLKIWLEDELAFLGECPWEDDLGYARAVCRQAGVPLEVISLQREYHAAVVDSAIEVLRAGGTPSPDVWCNQRIKFGVFFDHISRLGEFDRVASGHYARIAAHDGRHQLLRGVDPVKDQTYFLHRLDQEQLARSCYPLGGYHKHEVRALAAELGLPNSRRRDSQGICFLGKIPFDEFVRSHLGERPGEIRDLESGRVLGEHRGLWFHTVGQRKGLGLGGGPWYVVRKDTAADVLWVTHRRHLERHARRSFLLPRPHWIDQPATVGRIEVRPRHAPATLGATLEPLDDGIVRIVLDRGDPGLAVGQSAVLYDGESLCLGGGIIDLERTAALD